MGNDWLYNKTILHNWLITCIEKVAVVTYNVNFNFLVKHDRLNTYTTYMAKQLHITVMYITVCYSYSKNCMLHFTYMYFLYIICPVLVVLGSHFASRFPRLQVSTLYRLPSVYILQCQTGKHDNNKKWFIVQWWTLFWANMMQLCIILNYSSTTKKFNRKQIQGGSYS